METMTGSPSSAPRSGLSAVAESLPTTSLSSGAGEVDTGLGDLEVVLPDLESTVRWFQHGYPTPLARWHHHPEIEFHLIVASHGQMMAGDRTLDFAPGQVTLMGPHLPHNWLSDLAPGESLEQRAEFAADLQELQPEEVPMNFLDPRPGTPFADYEVMEASDALRAIGAFRLALPKTILRFAGGRELTLGDLGAEQGLQGGINAIIVGNYLTTLGRPQEQDLDMMDKLGLPIKALNATV